MRAERALSTRQAATKRAFDVVVAAAVLVVTLPVTAVAWVVATLDTRAPGLFRQSRVGLDGQPFELMKIRTMRAVPGVTTTITSSGDIRITRSGAVFRRLKIDELPQLVNVLRGEMSLVGPRPDVLGFADRLDGPDRILLTVRPGMTGPAALAYRHEEALLAASDDPESYNRDTIWPDKVRLNRAYVENYSFLIDLRCLVQTVGSVVSTNPDETNRDEAGAHG